MTEGDVKIVTNAYHDAHGHKTQVEDYDGHKDQGDDAMTEGDVKIVTNAYHDAHGHKTQVEDYDGHKKRGDDAMKEGDFTTAMNAYDHALSLKQAEYRCWSNASFARLQAGLPYEALLYARRATETNPKWAKGHAREGDAQMALAQYDKAFECFCRALKLERSPEYKVRAQEALQMDRKTCRPSFSMHTWKCAQVRLVSSVFANQLFAGLDRCLVDNLKREVFSFMGSLPAG